MSERSVTHATFRIERTYDAAPERVFAAFAEREAKLQWTACHDVLEWDFDFREGGRELTRMRSDELGEIVVEHRYHDIVAGQRIVFSYDMRHGGVRVSVALSTVELARDGSGTRLTFTEQGAYLDGGASPADIEHGTREGLENLAAFLARQLADA
jgi:uncharacterized protein YndB with AHSA1/START domain